MGQNALIVEDDVARAKLHELAFQDCGVASKIASNVWEAIRFLKNMPTFDIVLCDLNFQPRDPENVDGVKVADWIREHRYPTHVSLCSARFDDRDVAYNHARERFDSSIPASGGEESYKKVIELASARGKERLKDSALRLQPKLSEDNQFQLLKVHELSKNSEEEFALSTSSNNESHFADGYKIVVVQPYFINFPVGNPFFAWVKADNGGVFVEVYKNPSLLAFQNDLEAALTQLNETMIKLHEELKVTELDAHQERLKAFLDGVYDVDIQSVLEEKSL